MFLLFRSTSKEGEGANFWQMQSRYTSFIETCDNKYKNVDAYKTSDPFICLNCYKRLIRFGKVKEQLELINAEIMKNYLLTREQQRRCKRLQNTNECNQQTVTSRKRLAFTQTLNLEQDEKPDFTSFTPIARINCTSSYAAPVSVVSGDPMIDPAFMRPKPSATPVKISVQYPSKK